MRHLPPHMRIWLAFVHLDRAYRTLRPLLSEWERKSFLHAISEVKRLFWTRAHDWFRAKWVEKDGRRVQIFDLNKREQKMVDDMT